MSKIKLIKLCRLVVIAWAVVRVGELIACQAAGIIPAIVDPIPVDVDCLTVIIVRETGKHGTTSTAQLNAMQSVLLEEAIEDAGGELRKFDPDQAPPGHWAPIAGRAGDLPWWGVYGTRWVEGAFPKNLEQALKVVAECR